MNKYLYNRSFETSGSIDSLSLLIQDLPTVTSFYLCVPLACSCIDDGTDTDNENMDDIMRCSEIVLDGLLLCQLCN